MANLIRSSKPGNEWTDNDLQSYNIKVVAEPDVEAFFGIPALPAANVSNVILDNLDMPGGDLTPGEENFFKLLEDANYKPALEACVDDFARFLLEMLGFNSGRTRRVHTRRELKMLMCGTIVSAQTDVAITEKVGNGSRYVLLVQEDKVRTQPIRSVFRILIQLYQRYLAQLSEGEPEPQLMAEALAAFRENNQARARDGQPPIVAHTFPAIIMIGTAAVFYKIPITQELAQAVGAGTYPEHATIVQKFQPPVDDVDEYLTVGMANLGNRRSVFECYEALKHLVSS